MKPEQPGVNGVHFTEARYLYFPNTAKKSTLLRARLNPRPTSGRGPEFVGGGRMFDDFLDRSRRRQLCL